MATNNRGGNRGGNSRRKGSNNNNPEGRNQYSRSPLATAATVGGAIAAGVFLWSRRNQISEQIGEVSERISDWRDGMASDGEDSGSAVSFGGSSSADASGGQRTQAEIAEEALTLKEIGQPS